MQENENSNFFVIVLYFINPANAQSWTPSGSGMNNTVYEFAIYNAELYAGGQFTTAGGNPANRVAKWDGTNWSALGTGVDGTVYRFCLRLRCYQNLFYFILYSLRQNNMIRKS